MPRKANGDRRKPTVTDVAREAGVSVATAGRALGNYGKVRPELRERVEAAAQLLGYSPNGVARSMRSGGTRSIGFVGADISNPFFATAMRGVCDVARDEGYEPILANSDDSVETERNAVRVMLEKQIEGIVVSPTSVIDIEHLQRAQAKGVRVVLLDRSSPALDVDSIVIDNVAAAREAVEHLIAQGHRRIGLLAAVDPDESPEFVTEPQTRRLAVHGPERPSIDRIRGYLATLEEHDLAPAKKYIRCPLLGTWQEAISDAEALLSQPQPPTAVFATDNVTTQALFTATRRLGLRLPDDLSLVGFDDLDWTTLVDPPLTVVGQSPQDMGRVAAERLFARIKGDESVAQRVFLPTRLIVRSSTASRRRKR